MKKIILTIFVLIFFTPTTIFAQEINCNNRYLTLVNPVRSRELWIDKTVSPLNDQYQLIKAHDFSSTWLLQYDILEDKDLISEIQKFDSNQELGVFLEISQKFAETARVLYPTNIVWYSPKAVFLSAYSQSERRRLIDKLFGDFKKTFGFYPKSVGAWWIDSYSLDYMKNKYGITSAIIVADQKTTDNYGVWGQWWGVAYYPSKVNILTPASSLDNKLGVVIIQWAQRDPNLAYGDGPKYSNYSLQANDYIRQGKNTKYFEALTNIYLDCKNPLGQITVGLETGIESVGYIKEYENQLKYLSDKPNLNIVTMSQFADKFASVFPEFPKQFQIGSDWILNTSSRMNEKLADQIKYQQNVSFKDFFVSQKEDFLNRNLEELDKKNNFYFPWFIVFLLGIGILFLYKKVLKIWIIGTLFIAASYGLILRSNLGSGWEVFYGPAISYLISVQIIIVIISYLVIWLLSQLDTIKRNFAILLFIPLSYGIDFIIQFLRFSHFGGRYYFGIALDNLRFFGFSFNWPFSLGFVDKDFSSSISVALLKIDFSKIWDNLYLAIIAYPLVHILFGMILGFLINKMSGKIRGVVTGIFIMLLGFWLIHIFQADPRLVQ